MNSSRQRCDFIMGMAIGMCQRAVSPPPRRGSEYRRRCICIKTGGIEFPVHKWVLMTTNVPANVFINTNNNIARSCRQRMVRKRAK